MTNTTDTPRTDAAKPYWDSAERENCVSIEFSRWLERELTASLENQYKAQAEIKEIRNALGDDGRRTHKEILEMAFKASGWREWKKKYIDLNNAHIAEGQDPAGTIWEHADKIQQELKTSKAEVERLIEELAEIKETYASIVNQPHFDEREVHCSCVPALREEVERLKKELAAWDYGTRAEREQEARKKAEAEVAKLNHQLLKTESALLQSQDINSFLDAEFRIACKRAEKAEEVVHDRIKSLAEDVLKLHKPDTKAK